MAMDRGEAARASSFQVPSMYGSSTTAATSSAPPSTITFERIFVNDTGVTITAELHVIADNNADVRLNG